MEALVGERKYSSYSFTTSALMGGEWSASRSGRQLYHLGYEQRRTGSVAVLTINILSSQLGEQGFP
jgi:hypothetical protein